MLCRPPAYSTAAPRKEKFVRILGGEGAPGRRHTQTDARTHTDTLPAKRLNLLEQRCAIFNSRSDALDSSVLCATAFVWMSSQENTSISRPQLLVCRIPVDREGHAVSQRHRNQNSHQSTFRQKHETASHLAGSPRDPTTMNAAN